MWYIYNDNLTSTVPRVSGLKNFTCCICHQAELAIPTFNLVLRSVDRSSEIEECTSKHHVVLQMDIVLQVMYWKDSGGTLRCNSHYVVK